MHSSRWGRPTGLSAAQTTGHASTRTVPRRWDPRWTASRAFRRASKTSSPSSRARRPQTPDSSASSTSSTGASSTTDFATVLAQAQATSAPTRARRAPASSGTLNRAGVDPVQWAKDFLTQLGAPVTASNVQAITAWEQAEGTKAAFNPLATTQSGFAGETQFNSVGVKNYASYQDGLDANVKVITNGLYGNILAALQQGNDAHGGRQGDGELPVGNRHRRGAGPVVAELVVSVTSDHEPCGIRSDSRVPIFLLWTFPPGLARALVAYSSDGLVVVDPDGTLRFASPAAERMLGYEPGETFGRNVFDLVHPDDQVGALEGFESTVSSADSRPLPTLVRLRASRRLVAADRDHRYELPRRRRRARIDAQRPRRRTQHAHRVGAARERGASPPDRRARARRRLDDRRRGSHDVREPRHGRDARHDRDRDAREARCSTTWTTTRRPTPSPTRPAARRRRRGARLPAHDQARPHGVDPHEHEPDHRPRRARTAARSRWSPTSPSAGHSSSGSRPTPARTRSPGSATGPRSSKRSARRARGRAGSSPRSTSTSTGSSASTTTSGTRSETKCCVRSRPGCAARCGPATSSPGSAATSSSSCPTPSKARRGARARLPDPRRARAPDRLRDQSDRSRRERRHRVRERRRRRHPACRKPTARSTAPSAADAAWSRSTTSIRRRRRASATHT